MIKTVKNILSRLVGYLVASGVGVTVIAICLLCLGVVCWAALMIWFHVFLFFL